MHDSTVFRDLAHHLERQATWLHEMGHPEWAGHFAVDADRLLEHAKGLAECERSLPGIGSLAGIDPGFKPAESDLARLRRREAAYRLVLEDIAEEGEYWTSPMPGMRLKGVAEKARAVLGEDGSG